ncbi:helix-turn-helix transcriptional regulator [Ruegeria sp. SCP11]|uniref:helix-turn-helix transcriptional regulator n=1 Tax=Ruegeria sp. SCP11 TaxID=3141378 RepID=UPI00333DE4B9
MPRIIPTIRAAAAAPIFQWLSQNEFSFDQFGDPGAYSFLISDDPLQAVPLHSLASFLRELCQLKGPDLPTRIIQETGDVSLAMMAPVAFSASSPGEAINIVGKALPYFSSHEHLMLERKKSYGVIRQFWGATFDAETLHYLHQFTAALLELFFIRYSTADTSIREIEITPHPSKGLEILKDRFRSLLREGQNVLTLRVANEALDAPIRTRDGAVQSPPPMPELDSLRGSGGLNGSVQVVLRAMLETGRPTLPKIAQVMGLSPRTFQRLLQQEGTSFSTILTEVRREAAAEWFELDEGTLRDLAMSLGYSHQSALTRAIRRWEGAPPRELVKGKR